MIVRRARVGNGSELRDVVIGEACDVGRENILANGLHLFPEAVLPDRSVRFRDPHVPLPDIPSLGIAATEREDLATRDPGDLEPAA